MREAPGPLDLSDSQASRRLLGAMTLLDCASGEGSQLLHDPVYGGASRLRGVE